MYTIDQFRKMGGKTMYVGTGTIKLLLNKGFNIYNFYSDKAELLIDDIHDHRSGFNSTILKGTLRNILYKIDGEDPESKYRLEYGECKEGSERVIVQDNVVFKETCRFDQIEGTSYFMEHDVLHSIELMTPSVITHMVRNPLVKQAPNFIIDTTKPFKCAFSEPKTDKECWEIIEYTINLSN
tara:strand:- start:6073 stop:6618 length:546 start_codon:yes stop_codon:yes gene_type:complete